VQNPLDINSKTFVGSPENPRVRLFNAKRTAVHDSIETVKDTKALEE
jgi:hypothetical protein